MAESSTSLVTNNLNIQKHTSEVQQEECAEDKKSEKVMEPMLLEDYKINEEPQTLKNLLSYLRSENTTALNEVISGLMYVLMLESGFVPSGKLYQGESFDFNYKRVLNLSSHLPRKWKIDNFCSFGFILQPFEQHICQLSCVSFSDDLLVNCVIRSVPDTSFNTILDPLAYIVNYNENLYNITFQNLKGLSQTFKERISFPAKCSILQESDVQFGFLPFLPCEVLLQVLAYLNYKDLLNLGKCCRLFRKLTQEPHLWRKLFLRDFGVKSVGRSYKELNEEYMKKVRVRDLRNSVHTRVGGRAMMLLPI